MVGCRTGNECSRYYPTLLKGRERKDKRGERIANTYIKGVLKLEKVRNQIERGRLKWFGYVKRRNEHRNPKI
jgi:hypothetical protein